MYIQSSNFPIALVIAVVVVGLMVAGIVYGFLQARQRREAMLELAQRLNLDFDPGTDRAIAERFSFLKQLAQGSVHPTAHGQALMAAALEPTIAHLLGDAAKRPMQVP